LNKKIDGLDSTLVAQLKTIDKLVKEIESLKVEGKEVRYYSLKDTFFLFDSTYSGTYLGLPDMIYPYRILADDDITAVILDNYFLPSSTFMIKLVDGKEVWKVKYDGIYAVDDITISSNYIYTLTHDSHAVIINIWNKDSDLSSIWVKPLKYHTCSDAQSDNYDDTIYYSPTNYNLSIEVYSNGDIVIAADGVKRFSSDGKLLAVYIEPCVMNITDIEVDEHGNLYIIDGSNDRMYKLDKDGNTIATWSISNARKIKAVNDIVYGLDGYKSLNIFDGNNGRLIESMDNCCIDFDVYNSMIYVIEETEYARRIVRYYNNNGTDALDIIKEYPLADYRSNMIAHDIKVSNDSIFVALQSNSGPSNDIKIYKYDKEGSKVDEWIITVDNTFDEEVRLAYKDGKLLAALEDENKIIVYDERGSILNEYRLSSPIPQSIIDIDYDGQDVYATLNDGIAIIDGDDGKIKKRLWLERDRCTLYGYIYYIPGESPRLSISSEKAIPPGTGCKDPDGDGPMEFGDVQFRYMGEIAVATVDIGEDTFAKRIYTLDQGNYRMQLFDENASFIGKINLIRSSVMHWIVGMEVDKQGYIYLADSYALMVFNPNGELVYAAGGMCYPFNSACYRPVEEDATIAGIDIDDNNGDIYVLYNNLEVTYIARFAKG